MKVHVISYWKKNFVLIAGCKHDFYYLCEDCNTNNANKSIYSAKTKFANKS